MSADLDRFDRMLLGVAPVASTSPAAPARPVARPLRAEWEPVITSTRPPRFVDHTPCPMCGTDRQGIEYHGELMSGAKVHTIAAHTAGMRRVDRRLPRCLGSGLRIVFVNGLWKGAN